MTKIESYIVKITKLAAEFAKMPINGGDTEEQAAAISKRKVAITNKIQRLKEGLLFEQYLELQSKEWKEEIISYKKFKDPGKEICISVNFTWGWLRVYINKNGGIEWY